MTTFTTQDRIQAEHTFEPIPFAGYIKLQEDSMDISEYILAAQATLKELKNNSSNTGFTDHKKLLIDAKLLKMIANSMIAWAGQNDK